jgi:tRNA A37 threonylcarbamoyladenosine synthetase subunit TsaC/SUA5/YrdC
MPKHQAALTLIGEVGEALASSSANHAGEPPPTTAQEAAATLGDEVDLILDGGRVPIGVASTILDLTTPEPKILRQGVLTHADLFGG